MTTPPTPSATTDEQLEEWTISDDVVGLRALRAMLARMLGWGRTRAGAVDHALRQVRSAATLRSALVLSSEQNLVPIAEDLHRLTLTEKRPFIVCNPRRSTTETSDSSSRTIADGMEALAAARGGTLCILPRKPVGLTAILVARAAPDRRSQLVVCATSTDDAETFGAEPVVIPPLHTRKPELDRIIDEYAVDAAERLYCTDRVRLSPAERAWVRTWAGESLAEIQRTTLRLVAVRDAGSINAAAALLNLSHVALGHWFKNREFSKLE